jgi:hypothetical protein
MIELLGWISTALTIISFIPKGETKIRAINAVACIAWIVYGIALSQGPIIAVNASVFILHTKYFIQNRGVKVDHSYIEPVSSKTNSDKKNESVDPDFMYKWIKRNSGK